MAMRSHPVHLPAHPVPAARILLRETALTLPRNYLLILDACHRYLTDGLAERTKVRARLRAIFGGFPESQSRSAVSLLARKCR